MNSRNSAAEVKFALRSDTRYLGSQYPSIPPPLPRQKATTANKLIKQAKQNKTKRKKSKEKQNREVASLDIWFTNDVLLNNFRNCSTS